MGHNSDLMMITNQEQVFLQLSEGYIIRLYVLLSIYMETLSVCLSVFPSLLYLSICPSHPCYHSTALNIQLISFMFGTAIDTSEGAWILSIMGFFSLFSRI